MDRRVVAACRVTRKNYACPALLHCLTYFISSYLECNFTFTFFLPPSYLEVTGHLTFFIPGGHLGLLHTWRSTGPLTFCAYIPGGQLDLLHTWRWSSWPSLYLEVNWTLDLLLLLLLFLLSLLDKESSDTPEGEENHPKANSWGENKQV